MGRWNGVGGKIEPGETITESVKREILEETGIEAEGYALRFAGQMEWEDDGKAVGGMYLFVAELAETIAIPDAAATREGVLAFKALDWILDAANTGVVDNVPYTLRHILPTDTPIEIKSVYKKNELTSITHQPLETTDILL